MTSKTPNLDEIKRLSLNWEDSTHQTILSAAKKDIAALESAHADEMRILRAELDEARRKMATMVCGTCRGTGCTHGYRGCTCHPCHVCQPKGT